MGTKYRALTGIATTINDVDYVIPQGERLDSTHPVVVAYPDAFEPYASTPDVPGRPLNTKK
jgi:hypothetical protein